MNLYGFVSTCVCTEVGICCILCNNETILQNQTSSSQYLSEAEAEALMIFTTDFSHVIITYKLWPLPLPVY